jgi:hypothetical protein
MFEGMLGINKKAYQKRRQSGGTYLHYSTPCTNTPVIRREPLDASAYGYLTDRALNRDARELVSELEFVWDQIKSNVPSSSSSSPLRNFKTPAQQPQLSRFGSFDARLEGEQPMTVLSPMSQDEDDDVRGEEKFDARLRSPKREGEYDDNDENEDDEDEGGIVLRGLHNKDRKWRSRIEHALVKMTAEIAALREHIEKRRAYEAKRRRSLWAWIFWLMWVSVKHVAVNALLLAAFLLWMKQRRDKRGLDLMRLLISIGRDYLRMFWR